MLEYFAYLPLKLGRWEGVDRWTVAAARFRPRGEDRFVLVLITAAGNEVTRSDVESKTLAHQEILTRARWTLGEKLSRWRDEVGSSPGDVILTFDSSGQLIGSPCGGWGDDNALRLSSQKRSELGVVDRVVRVRGGHAVPVDDRWPDAVINDGGKQFPVEVIRTFELAEGEDLTRGSAVEAARAHAEREANRLTAVDGEARAYGSHAVGTGARSFVLDLSESESLPLPMNHANPVRWLVAAVEQKMAKEYDQADRTILVIDYRWMEPYDWELQEMADLLGKSGCPFREVWVVPELISKEANVAMQVPLKRRGS